MKNKKQLNLWQVKLGLLVLWFFGLMIFSQLGIVFNHYIHRFGLVIYIALSVLIASLKWKPKIGSDGFTVRRTLITLSIASLVIYPLFLRINLFGLTKNQASILKLHLRRLFFSQPQNMTISFSLTLIAKRVKIPYLN